MVTSLSAHALRQYRSAVFGDRSNPPGQWRIHDITTVFIYLIILFAVAQSFFFTFLYLFNLYIYYINVMCNKRLVTCIVITVFIICTLFIQLKKVILLTRSCNANELSFFDFCNYK